MLIIVTIPLCSTDELPDPGSKAFEVEHQGKTRELFVVHKDGSYFAYINSCPHTGVNLEWLEDQFLDMESTFIQCSTHDALFEIDTGTCIAGPCVGDKLSPVVIEVIDNTLHIKLED